ncbi:MAG: homocysteine S-methyltransferase [Acidobacterium ailaaui]|nr:homocysteine S-methyltransferase [Pseudacidobacterium ailaaui]
MKAVSLPSFSAIRVLDGGMATELERRGCNISGPLWSAHVLEDSPETIEAVHLSYLEAGADCILTASYQVSALGYGDMQKAAVALRRSVELALRAREQYCRQSLRPVWIGASLGPYGASLHNGAEYHGNYEISHAQLVQFHAERLAVLQDTEADFVAFETVPSLEEASAIIEALRQFPEVRGWVSFTCKDEVHVAHGERLADCAAFLDTVPQVLAVGVNCTHPKYVRSLVHELKRSTQKAIVAYPNSGEVWDAERRCWTGKSNAAEFGRLASEWAEAGAQTIGGCCRTGPEHIRCVAEALKAE